MRAARPVIAAAAMALLLPACSANTQHQAVRGRRILQHIPDESGTPAFMFPMAFVVVVLVMSMFAFCLTWRIAKYSAEATSGRAPANDDAPQPAHPCPVDHSTPADIVQALPVMPFHMAVAMPRGHMAASNACKGTQLAQQAADAKQVEEGQEQQACQQVQVQVVVQQGKDSQLSQYAQVHNSSDMPPCANDSGSSAASSPDAATSGVASSSEDEHMVCAICFEVYSANDKVKQLPCMHFFHPGCIDAWLAKDTHCPLCIKPVDVLAEATTRVMGIHPVQYAALNISEAGRTPDPAAHDQC